MAGQRPNILWLCTDQQRFDTIGALGNGLIRTPNLDRLCAEGVAFTSAYCQSPVCTPSRASMLTGRYPRTTRCRQNGQMIPADERLLPRMLADHGYTCGLAGKLHLASCSGGKVEARIDDGYSTFHWSHHPQPDWEENAYTRWLSSKGKTWGELYGPALSPYVTSGVPAEFHQTTWCAQMTIDFLREHAQTSGGWMFSFNCFAPHHPFDPPPEYLSRYRAEDMPLPKWREGELTGKPTYQQLDAVWAHNTPGYFHVGGMTDADKRQITAAYYAMCEHIDHEVGRVLAALDESGQRENTIVIFMSDHGEMLGDHGLYMKGPHFYEEAVHVPLIVRGPGFEKGLRSEALVELTDIVPTMLEAAGLPPEAEPQVQGRSLLPILTGRSNPAQHRDEVFSEYYNAWSHKHSYGSMLRTREAKIVVYHGTEQGELYDLVSDPGEFENLWDSESHARLKVRMMKRAFDASVFTMDPMPARLGDF